MTLEDQAELKDLLVELEEYFDDRQDIVDGDNGQPRPNDAMRFLQRVKRCLDAVERETDFAP